MDGKTAYFPEVETECTDYLLRMGDGVNYESQFPGWQAEVTWEDDAGNTLGCDDDSRGCNVVQRNRKEKMK